MRAAVYAVLLSLAIASALTGHLGTALALAAAKALLVGGEYMELRHAHRAHLFGFALFVVALAIALTFTASASPPAS